MARRIDKLKNREEIVDAILAGRTDREISKLAGVSHVAVGNYRREIIRPRLSAAAKVNREMEIANESVGLAAPAPDYVELTRQAVGADLFVHRITKRYQLIERQIDRCGHNVRKLTSLLNTERGLMEFHAKVTGLYTDAPRADIGFAPCVMVQVNVAEGAPAPREAAIDCDVDPADFPPRPG